VHFILVGMNVLVSSLVEKIHLIAVIQDLQSWF